MTYYQFNPRSQLDSVLQHAPGEVDRAGEEPAAATIDGISVHGVWRGPSRAWHSFGLLPPKVAFIAPPSFETQWPDSALDPKWPRCARGSGRAGDAAAQTIKRAALSVRHMDGYTARMSTVAGLHRLTPRTGAASTVGHGRELVSLQTTAPCHAPHGLLKCSSAQVVLLTGGPADLLLSQLQARPLRHSSPRPVWRRAGIAWRCFQDVLVQQTRRRVR